MYLVKLIYLEELRYLIGLTRLVELAKTQDIFFLLIIAKKILYR